MREERARGGGSSARPGRLGPGLVALCLWLGLAVSTAAQQTPEVTLRRGEPDPSEDADTGIKNIQLVVPFTEIPTNLPPSGNVRLFPDGPTNRILEGTYRSKQGTLTVTVNVERGLKKVSYTHLSIDPSDTRLAIQPTLDIFRVQPKELIVELDSESSTDDSWFFWASMPEIPQGEEGSLCEGGQYIVRRETSERVDWQIQDMSELMFKDSRPGVSFQLDRRDEVPPNLDVVLELCQGGHIWVYRGNLPSLSKTDSQVDSVLDVEWRKLEGPNQILVLKVPDGPGKLLSKAEVLEGADGIPDLKEGSMVSFQLSDGFYQAEIPFSCSSGEIKLPRLVLAARDRNGRYVFRSSREETLCSSSPYPVTRWLIGLLVLAALAVGAFIWQKRLPGILWKGGKSSNTSNPSSSPPQPGGGNRLAPDPLPRAWKEGLAEVMHSQLNPLYETMQEVKVVLSQVRDHQARSSADLDIPQPAYGIAAREQEETSVSFRPPQAQPVAALTDLINRWWSDGANREWLADLIGSNSAVKPYRSFNVQDSLRSTTNRTFLFQPSENLVEWLGCSQQGDLFLVPGDPKLFQTGDSLKFLGALFEGLGTSLSNVRFRRVVRACRLKREPGFTDRYRLAERGILELEGQAAVEARHSPGVAPSRAPKSAQVLQEREIAEVVFRSVREAIPRGLPEQIHDLSQQVLALSLGGLRPRTESPRPDADISAALGELRQGLSTLAQRMNGIESTSKHVEALGESIARIEGGLRDLHSRQPLPVAPVAPVAPAVPEPVPAVPDANDVDPGIVRWNDFEALDFPDSPSFVPAPDLPEAPEQLWSRLQSWWPSVVDGGTPEGYAGMYTRCLHKAHQTLIAASADRGWKVDVVHVKIPDNSPAGEPILQVHTPLEIEEERILCSCAPRSPFTDALLFQFALQVRGDQGRELAVLPAPGLRLKGSTESYARLNGGKLPEHATWLAEVTQPAILSQLGKDDLYTVVRPMLARFGSSRGPVW